MIRLYREKYSDDTFEHFTELLASDEGINISVSAMRRILEAALIFSPRTTKAKRDRLKSKLELQLQEAKSQNEAEAIRASIASLEKPKD